jgi:hypothetical protein
MIAVPYLTMGSFAFYLRRLYKRYHQSLAEKPSKEPTAGPPAP